jgi:hypothetical protein
MIFLMLSKDDFIARCMNWIYSSGMASGWNRSGDTTPGRRRAGSGKNIWIKMRLQKELLRMLKTDYRNKNVS